MGIANDYKCQRIKYFGDFYVSFFDIFLLVGKKRGDGFYVGFQKMDYVYLYGSSVRMGQKVYIIPILLDDAAYRDHFHQT